MTATQYTATITWADYFTGELGSTSYTGTRNAAEFKMEQWKMNLGTDILTAEILPTGTPSVLEVAQEITAREDAAELVAIRSSLEDGTRYHKTWRGSPVPA